MRKAGYNKACVASMFEMGGNDEDETVFFSP